MKILFYNHTGQVSGAERVLQMILNGLDRERYQCVVACPEKSKLFELMNAAGERTRGLRLLEARFTWRPDRLLRYLSSFVQVIRDARTVVNEEAPDAIHANSIRAGIVMAAATIGLRVPVIWHGHDILPRHPLSTVVRLFALLSARNRILTVSQAVVTGFRGAMMKPFARRVPICVIHNAVDLERFKPNSETRVTTRAALALTDTQSVIGMVGQLTPRKGQLELLESFARVAREIPDAVLLIVGEPLFNRDEEFAEGLRRRAASLGIDDRVRFLGARSDVPQLMQAIDALVVNSHEEPFALTVLEGLASGVAVVATAVGGTPEMITNGENGCLVPARDNEALAKSLITLLHEPELRAWLGHNARQVAEARFSTNRFLREVDTFYMQLPHQSTPSLTPQLLGEKLATD
jgi:glycosyltransferase involved in cell wall biosynthesis